jgi:hypothetical protein
MVTEETSMMFPYTSDSVNFRKSNSSIFNTEPLCWLLVAQLAVDRRAGCFREIHKDVMYEDAAYFSYYY